MKKLLILSCALWVVSLFCLSCEKTAPPDTIIPVDTIPKCSDNSIEFQLHGDTAVTHCLYCDGKPVKIKMIEFKDERLYPDLCNVLAMCDFNTCFNPARIKLSVEYLGVSDTISLTKASCNPAQESSEFMIGPNKLKLWSVKPIRTLTTMNADSIFQYMNTHPAGAIYSDSSTIMPPIPLKKIILTFRSDTTICPGHHQ